MNITKLDNVFSQYIRLKNSINGYCACISCGKIQHWKQMDAGHFINRKHLSLRWNEINVNPQCRAENRFDEGNLPAYGLALQKKYGEDIIKKLLIAKNTPSRFTQYEIDQLTIFYKNEVKKLLKDIVN